MIKKKLIIIFAFYIVSLVLPLDALADRSTGGDITNFDISPKTITAGQQVRITLRLLVYGGSPSAFMSYCGVSSNRAREVKWSVFERLSNGQDRAIQDGQVLYDPFTYSNKSYDVSFDKTLPDLAGSRTFLAQIRCITNSSPLAGSTMATSAGVNLTQNPSGGPPPGPPAPQPNPGVDLNFPNPLQSETIWGLFNGLINLALKIALPLAVVLIVYSGIMFLFSRGNPGAITKARTILTWTVVGLAVLLIGKGFLTLIRSILELSNG